MACSSSICICMQRMHANTRPRVRVNDTFSDERWRLVFSRALPLLFIMVLEELSNELRTGCPW